MFLVLKYLTPRAYSFEACRWLYDNNNILDFLVCTFTLSEEELKIILKGGN